MPDSLEVTSYEGDGTGYYIIQFDGPIYESDKAAVTALGAELFDYIPDFAFIARMDAATANAARSLSTVRWVGIYQPAYRIEPDLAAKYVGLGLSTPAELLVITFKGEDVAGIASQLESLGGTILEVTQTNWKGKIRVQIDSIQVSEIANISGVSWIEATPEWRLFNNTASDIIGVRPVWDNHGLYGTGQTVAVCDTGLDQGSTAPSSLHDDFENGSGASRVISLYDLVGDGASDVNSGHGTHVAGSVLGNGDLSGATPSTHYYPNTAYVGMAPEVNLVFQSVENNTTQSLSGIPADLNTLFLQAYTANARIHSNSWGGGAYGSYSSYSQDVDEFMWDYPFMLILFAASNDGVDENADGVIDLLSTTPPGTAKNCITVGASENNRPGLGAWGPGDPRFPAGPINIDDAANNSSGLAAFSSRGSTLDGRTKPDVVAPGTFVASVRSSVASGTGWGTIDANYMYMGGTSMATPLVAGTSAVEREYFVNLETYAPTGALLKATLANGATDIYPGQYGTGGTQEIATTRPSQQAGWGRVNLEDSLFPGGSRETWYWDNSSDITSSLNSLSTGETATYTLEVTASDPLSITLGWTDYPGTSAAAGGLVNDLDLKVEGPGGTTYYPNNASQRGATQHMAYGVPRVIWTSTAGYLRAERFTPSSYPVTVDKALMFVGSATPSWPKTFTYYIYDDDGTGGAPGTVLATGTATMRRSSSTLYDYKVIDLSGHGVTIASGDFYIGLQIPDSDFLYAGDNTLPAGRGWYNNGGGWFNSGSNDYSIEAVVKGADASTNYDRVNNLVGIDIASPATGIYTITVNGYNIPQGPQNYALVVSGVGRLLGEETVTRPIAGTGTYKFGNAGVTMNFASENVDTVSVNVHRDTLLPTTVAGDSSIMIERYYYIQSSGGTGAFNATLVFSYEDAELNGLTESNLRAYRWRGTGLGWQEYIPSGLDTTNNTMTVTGVTEFSYWTLGVNPGPTAVSVQSFDTNTASGVTVGLVVASVPALIVGGLVIWHRKRGRAS
ncbi:MAG: S8 family serine peptidase [Anaerolineae bacterium]|nr:S8 family serine peptidase [Anaerolineae bacterium]